MKSMTGYGSSENSSEALDLTINVKAVNGRYFDPRIHLPREYNAFESDIKKQLAGVFSRGTIDIYISRKLKDSAQKTQVTLRTELAKKWVSSMKSLGKELKLENDLSLDSLTGLSFLTKIDEDYSIKTNEKKLVLELVKKASMACDKERTREGTALKKHLMELLKGLSAEVKKIEAIKKTVNKSISDRLKKRMEAVLEDTRLDPARLAQEVAIMIDKSDITEEITRLKEHIKSVSKLMTSKKTIGKKLDFYSQELLREVNTIGSKAGHSGITAMVVESKNLIERFREQVQNVE